MVHRWEETDLPLLQGEGKQHSAAHIVVTYLSRPFFQLSCPTEAIICSLNSTSSKKSPSFSFSDIILWLNYFFKNISANSAISGRPTTAVQCTVGETTHALRSIIGLDPLSYCLASCHHHYSAGYQRLSGFEIGCLM